MSNPDDALRAEVERRMQAHQCGCTGKICAMPRDHSYEGAITVVMEMVQQERERCAKVAEAHIPPPQGSVDTGVIWRSGTAKMIADNIRKPPQEPTDEQ